MAFSTIQGSGGAPDSFVGTSGVDAIAVANSTGNFFLGANAAADNIQVLNSGAASYSDVLATSTMKGGAGDDTMTLGNATATIFTGLFANGGADKDTITSNVANSFIASTIQGGKANDTITLGIVTSSKVNGNLGNDTVSVDAATTASSVYGGGGNDVINAGTAAFTKSLISGDKGNDIITLEGTNTSIDDLTIKGGDGVDTIDVSDNGATTDEGIFVAGNAGADTITGSDNAVTKISLYGGAGNDTITSGAGAVTVVGGAGNDTMAAGAGSNTFLYTDRGQSASTSGSATSTSTYTGGDSITAFQSAGTDVITLDASEMLVGSSATVAAGGANSWNLNNTGLYACTADLGDATFNEVTLTIGTVTGDAGDVAYVAFYDGTDSHLFEVQLGTKKTAAALNAGDTVTLIATINGEQNTTADYAFVA